MAFYKFLHSGDVDKVLVDETLMVSSFDYFRTLEREGIGDELEGASAVDMPSQFPVTQGSENLAALNAANIGFEMFQKFAEISGGARMECGGLSFVHVLPQMHIYSFSEGGLGELKATMCGDEQDPYDACLEILDPHNLLIAIFMRGVIAATGQTTQEAFAQNIGGSVEYAEVRRNVLSGPAITPNPFRKGLRFASQREHRFLFDSSAGGLPNRLIIKVPGLAENFRRMF